METIQGNKIEELLKPSEEIWKPVVGYEGLYEVSNLCRAKSLPRLVKSGSNSGRMLPEKIMKTWWGKKDQLQVSITKDKKTLYTTVYRLMMIAFVPNPDKKPTVNHTKGNRRYNSLPDLEWATWSENNKHAYDTGLNDPIVNLPKNHKKVAKCSLSGVFIEQFDSLTEAANSVNGTPQTISAVCNNKQYCKSAFGYKWKFI